MTLPLIYTLQNADRATRRKIIYIVKNQNTDREKVNEVISYVKESGGIEYAHKKMKEYQRSAFEMLQKYPDSPARKAMEELVNYVIDRSH